MRLILLHPLLPFWVGLDVSAVVVEQIALNLRLAGAVEKRVFVSPKIGVIELNVRIISNVSLPGGGERKQIRSQGFFMRRTISPESATRIPVGAQAFVVADSVLNNESIHTLRMRENHAEANRAAVILHIERISA